MSRELDAQIAERVMGFHREIDETHDYDHVQHRNEVLLPPGETLEHLRELLPRKGQIPFAYFVTERYSTDIAAAWKVVEKMRELDWRMLLENWVAVTDAYAAFFRPQDRYNYEKHIGVTDDTAPLAICRAALAALGE